MKRRKPYFLPVAAFLAFLTASVRAAEPSLEYAVKGTYLYKFGAFVEWPAAAFEGPDGAVTLCIVGRDPFGPALDQAIAGQRIGPRPVRLRRLRALGLGLIVIDSC